mmetsp:Transcript_21635/g.66507  ORF Transcript_21635/g.66507 Transcript_21635/m.66507 type:complete len:231 (+) Transcript_21635:298-990(+)
MVQFGRRFETSQTRRWTRHNADYERLKLLIQIAATARDRDDGGRVLAPQRAALVREALDEPGLHELFRGRRQVHVPQARAERELVGVQAVVLREVEHEFHVAAERFLRVDETAEVVRVRDAFARRRQRGGVRQRQRRLHGHEAAAALGLDEAAGRRVVAPLLNLAQHGRQLLGRLGRGRGRGAEAPPRLAAPRAVVAEAVAEHLFSLVFSRALTRQWPPLKQLAIPQTRL